MVIGAANPHGFLTVYNVLLYFKNEQKKRYEIEADYHLFKNIVY